MTAPNPRIREREIARLLRTHPERSDAHIAGAVDAAWHLFRTIDDPDARMIAASFVARQQLVAEAAAACR